MDCLLMDFRGSAASRENSDPTETGKAPQGWAHANSICRNEFHEVKLINFREFLIVNYEFSFFSGYPGTRCIASLHG